MIKKNENSKDRNTADGFIDELIQDMNAPSEDSKLLNSSQTSRNQLTLQIKEENKEALDDTLHFSTDEQLN